jgi:hypothetical protein
VEGEEKSLNLNCGRSTLFSCSPNELTKKFNSNPLVIKVTMRNSSLGSCTIAWPKNFLDLIKKAPETFGVSGPVSIQDKFILVEPNTSKIMGDIMATVRLSSFGNSIQTSFQLIDQVKAANKKFLVKGARGETTFECQKYAQLIDSSRFSNEEFQSWTNVCI